MRTNYPQIFMFFAIGILLPKFSLAELLYQDSQGNIIAKIPYHEVVVSPEGEANFKGKRYNCKASKQSFIVGSAVLSCSNSNVNLASPEGSFSYNHSNGSASVILTSGMSETRSFSVVSANNSRKVAVEGARSNSLSISDESDPNSNILIKGENNSYQGGDSAEVTIESDDDSGRNEKIIIKNSSKVAQIGMNNGGLVIGEIVEGASGGKHVAQETSQGISISGNTITTKNDQLSIQSSNGKKLIIGSSEGGIVATSNGQSWRITSEDESYDDQEIFQELKVQQSENQIQIDMTNSVLFDFNSSSIRPAASKTLSKVAYLIKKKSAGKVYIEGHTDSIGGEEANVILSQKRLSNVINWLAEAEGIPYQVMEGVAYGESQPIAPNLNPDGSDNPDGRAKNRRVVFKFDVN